MAKYNPEIISDICKYLRAGNTQKDTCILVGINNDTFHEWMKKAEFSEQIKKAQQECKSRNIAIIQKAAEKTWQAAAWWLERKHKDEFALRTENTGKDGAPLTGLVIIKDGSTTEQVADPGLERQPSV